MPHRCIYGEPHRLPQGPNEIMAVCPLCSSATFRRLPPGETDGLHAHDCSLPIHHASHCEPGGAGHPQAPVIRGHWPNGPRHRHAR